MLKLKNKKNKILLTAVLISCLMSFSVYSQDISQKVIATLVFKILGHDRSLNDRAGDVLNVAVFYLEDEAHKEKANNFIEYFAIIAEEFEIRKIKAKATVFPVKSKKELRKNKIKNNLAENGFLVAVFFIEDESVLRELINIGLDEDMNMISGLVGERYVDSGVTLGFSLYNGKPKILVNVKTLKKEKSEYSSKLLSLCKKIK